MLTLIIMSLIGGIILLLIAACASMRQSGVVRRLPQRRIVRMRDRESEIHGRIKERTGHVDTVYIPLPDPPDPRKDDHDA